MHHPPHPGELIPNFMQGRSVTEVAKHLGVTRATLSRVIHGKAAISAEMSMRLAEVLGLEPEIWLRMQVTYDLWVASQRKRVKRERMVFDQAA
jgi:addiction module HigA family antidote